MKREFFKYLLEIEKKLTKNNIYIHIDVFTSPGTKESKNESSASSKSKGSVQYEVYRLFVGKSDDTGEAAFSNKISSKSIKLGGGLYAISSPPKDPLLASGTEIKIFNIVIFKK